MSLRAVWRAVTLAAVLTVTAGMAGMAGTVPAAAAGSSGRGPVSVVQAKSSQLPLIGLEGVGALLAPRGPGGAGAGYQTLAPPIYDEFFGDLTHVHVAVDARSLAGVADVVLPSACRWTSTLRASCSLARVRYNREWGPLAFRLRAAAGAVQGADGRLVLDVRADGTLRAHASESVSVRHNSHLVPVALPAVHAAPGGTAGFRPVFTNMGDRDTTGFNLYVDVMGQFSLGNGHRNCAAGLGRFLPPDSGLGGDFDGPAKGMLCHFDTVVHPGESVTTSAPISVDAAAGASSGTLAFSVGGLGTHVGNAGSPQPGTGPALTLVKAPASTRPPADAAFTWSGGATVYAPLLTGRTDDLKVTAADAVVQPGRTSRLTLVLTNKGSNPTSPQLGAPKPTITATVVVFVPKVLAATQPWPGGCMSEVAVEGQMWPYLEYVNHGLTVAAAGLGSLGDPGSTDEWICPVYKVLQPGQSTTLTVAAKPARPTGPVPVTAVSIGSLQEATPADNVAHFTVTASPKPPAGSPTASAAGGRSGGTPPAGSAPGSTLAATGGSDALPLAGAGLAVVVLGGAAVALTRRRSGNRT